MIQILLVEDDAVNRDMLARYLALVGYGVTIAANGVEAVEHAQAQTPDIILMDMRLPIMDGWEATRALKQTPTTAGIPVVALTAYAMSEDRQKCLEAGCDAYVSKPVEMPELLATLQSLVGRGPR